MLVQTRAHFLYLSRTLFWSWVHSTVKPSQHVSRQKTCSCCMSWWRHQMEIFSVLLAICAGNSPVPGEFPAQRPVTWNFDVFFDLRPNQLLSKQSWGWWFETPSRPLWRHRNVTTEVWVSFKCIFIQILVAFWTLRQWVINEPKCGHLWQFIDKFNKCLFSMRGVCSEWRRKTQHRVFFFTNVSRALQNNLAKIYNARNYIYVENFKLKFCTCAQSISLGTSTTFQLEVLMRRMIYAIHKIERIFWRACETLVKHH